MQTNQWYKSKHFRFTFLMVTIQVYLVFNHILPIYEEIPYHTSKIESLKQNLAELEINSKHYSFFQHRELETKATLYNLQQEQNRLKNKREFQSLLNQYYQQTGIQVISQQIEAHPFDSELSLINVILSLKGDYQKMSAFFRKIDSLSSFVVVSQCEIINQSPLSTNPDLTMNGKLTIYLIENL